MRSCGSTEFIISELSLTATVVLHFSPGIYADWDRCSVHGLNGISGHPQDSFLNCHPEDTITATEEIQKKNCMMYPTSLRNVDLEFAPQIVSIVLFFLGYFYFCFKCELKPGFLHIKCRWGQ